MGNINETEKLGVELTTWLKIQDKLLNQEFKKCFRKYIYFFNSVVFQKFFIEPYSTHCMKNGGYLLWKTEHADIVKKSEVICVRL